MLITRNGGVEVIVAAMGTHIDNVEVAHWACRAFSSLAGHAVNKVLISEWMDCLCVMRSYVCVYVIHRFLVGRVLSLHARTRSGT